MLTPSDKFDIHAPKKYLEYTETPAYRAFRDRENQASGASNFAVLKSLDNAAQSIAAVEDYYTGTRSVPKFMFPADAVPPAQARGTLTKAGYVLCRRPAVRMHLEARPSPLLAAHKCPVVMAGGPLAMPAASLLQEYGEGQDFALKLIDRQLAKGARAFVALNRAEVPVSICVGLGYADAFCIQVLYTAQTQRRQGYGAAVLLAALAWAKAPEQAYGEIFLDCGADEEDAPARRLFEKAGFAGAQAPMYGAFQSLVPPGWQQCTGEEF